MSSVCLPNWPVFRTRGRGNRRMFALRSPSLLQSFHPSHHTGVLFICNSTWNKFRVNKRSAWLMPLLHSSSRLLSLHLFVLQSWRNKLQKSLRVTAMWPCIINIQSVPPFWIICICLPPVSFLCPEMTWAFSRWLLASVYNDVRLIIPVSHLTFAGVMPPSEEVLEACIGPALQRNDIEIKVVTQRHPISLESMACFEYQKGTCNVMDERKTLRILCRIDTYEVPSQVSLF